ARRAGPRAQGGRGGVVVAVAAGAVARAGAVGALALRGRLARGGPAALLALTGATGRRPGGPTVVRPAGRAAAAAALRAAHRAGRGRLVVARPADRKSTRLNSSHVKISYAVFCLKKKKSHGQGRCRRHKNTAQNLFRAAGHERQPVMPSPYAHMKRKRG